MDRMMSLSSQIPEFEPLLCQSQSHEHLESPFTPSAHDFIIFNQDGNPQIAENASASQMINALRRSNDSYASKGDENQYITAALTIIRFEEEEPFQGNQSQSDNNWSALWPIFDCCSSDDSTNLGFVARLRQAESQCTALVSKTTRKHGPYTMDCKKIYYHVSFPDKHLLLAHHFHVIDGKRKEMIRMVTYGLELPRIKALLYKAMSFLRPPSSGSNNEVPRSINTPARIPHPKAILCSMLECAEEFCKSQVARYRTRIEKIESGINAQRDTGYSQPRGLEINYVKLSEANIKLSEIRQKIQYSLSSITSLEEMTGVPACDTSQTFSNNSQPVQGVFGEPQDQLCGQWWHQLDEAKVRLVAAKGNFHQHNINIENLQERARGILSIVSILLAERENEWGRRAQIQRQETYDNQLAIIKYQTKMLEQQEFVVAQTKRDNTVMKVIAILTALFLPGTFIATVFSVPVFNWDQENPIGPHFKTYWYFTAPITTVLVVGLSAWLLKMHHDDRLEEKRRKEREAGVEDST